MLVTTVWVLLSYSYFRHIRVSMSRPDVSTPQENWILGEEQIDVVGAVACAGNSSDAADQR